MTESNRERRDRRPVIRRDEPEMLKLYDQIEEALQHELRPYKVKGLKGFQHKLLRQRYEKSKEYALKSYRDGEEVIFKVYPVGQLKRMAEQKVQEVLMNGRAAALPPMGAYERFVIHDYLKDREGISTESLGTEGKDRHVILKPMFGRDLKKSKRRLTR